MKKFINILDMLVDKDNQFLLSFYECQSKKNKISFLYLYSSLFFIF